jgi:hypothetical protein
MREVLLDRLAYRRQEKRRRCDGHERCDQPRGETARALALEAADRLEPLIVIVVFRNSTRARCRGYQERERRAALLRARRRNNGKAICPQREIDLGPAAPIFRPIPFVRGLAATPIHDDLELVVRAERRSEGRDEVTAAKPIARDDTEARVMISHEDLLQ